MKNSSNIIVGFRHFQDVDEIKTHGQDGPLIKDGQNEQLARNSAESILAIAREFRFDCLRIIFSPSLKRVSESVRLISETFAGRIAYTLEENDDLRCFDQGKLRLPPEYKDGEPLPTAINAWDAYCDATYLDQNIHYRFGDPNTGKLIREDLVDQFETFGESEADYLMRKYAFLLSLLKEHTPAGELPVFCSQSNPLLLLREVFAIERDTIEPIPENLHFLCWRYFISEIQGKDNQQKEHFIQKIAKHNPEFGQVLFFDKSEMNVPKWRDILTKAKECLTVQKRNQ